MLYFNGRIDELDNMLTNRYKSPNNKLMKDLYLTITRKYIIDKEIPFISMLIW